MKTLSKFLLAAVFCASSCAWHNNKAAYDWHAANVHRVLVACVQGDREMNRRLEFYITPQLRHQGFEAITIADLLPNTTTYSPKDLLRQMQRAKMDGVMQVTYRGEAPSNGTPQEVHFKYHSIKGRSPTLSTHPNPLDSALVELINGLARGETK